MFVTVFYLCLIYSLLQFACSQFAINDSLSILPKNGPSRSVMTLNGIWLFRLQRNNQDGFQEKWFNSDWNSIDEPIERMPVPSSFNDITQSKEIRDFSGWVWYQTHFSLPSVWGSSTNQFEDVETVLRFGSINYHCKVWLNGILIAQHVGGHLPFQTLVTPVLKLAGNENCLTVAVNNELSDETLPSGTVQLRPDYEHPGQNITEMIPNFDFFPYAGIHRAILLHLLPKKRIVDITVRTDVQGHKCFVEYSIQTNAQLQDNTDIQVKLFEKTGKPVAIVMGSKNRFSLNNAKLWYPFPGVKNNKPGYRYKMIVELLDGNTLLDRVEQSIGIRSVELRSDGFYINNFPVYLRGFGRHEDETIRGRSISLATMIKDFNLMKWSGANSFRTSHYPYSEEIMEEADEEGFLVINEVPAVGLERFNNSNLLNQHLKTIRQLIDRDKNRPSVIAWSIANEPKSNQKLAELYFKTIANAARKADWMTKRPVTAAISLDAKNDFASFSLDFIMINRYFAWYSDSGYVQVIRGELPLTVKAFIERFHVPIMISEYGADTIPGLHSDPSYVFTEEYQVELLSEYHYAFDKLRIDKKLIGEHVWNFADFQTKQDIKRVGGNRKGIFTRDRRPKTAASVLRCRYWSLAEDMHSSIDQYYRQGVTLCPKVVL